MHARSGLGYAITAYAATLSVAQFVHPVRSGSTQATDDNIVPPPFPMRDLSRGDWSLFSKAQSWDRQC